MRALAQALVMLGAIISATYLIQMDHPIFAIFIIILSVLVAS